MSNIEDEANYEVDVKNTLISNVFVLIFSTILISYSLLFAGVLKTFQSEEVRLLGTFVYAYSILHIMGYLSRMCHIHFRKRMDDSFIHMTKESIKQKWQDD